MPDDKGETTIKITDEVLAEIKDRLGVDAIVRERDDLRDKVNRLEGRLEAQPKPRREFGHNTTQREWELEAQIVQAQAAYEEQQAVDNPGIGTKARDRWERMQSEYGDWAQSYNADEAQRTDQTQSRQRLYDDIVREQKLDPESTEGRLVKSAIEAGLSRDEIDTAYFGKIREVETEVATEEARRQAAAADLNKGTIEGGEARPAPSGGETDEPETMSRTEALKKLTTAARQGRRPATAAGLGIGVPAKVAEG